MTYDDGVNTKVHSINFHFNIEVNCNLAAPIWYYTDPVDGVTQLGPLGDGESHSISLPTDTVNQFFAWDVDEAGTGAVSLADYHAQCPFTLQCTAT